MATDVYLFLPKPASSTDLREAHPYGPSDSGFHTDLAIEIDPSQIEQNRAVAIVSGMTRLILDPLSPQTCTLILIPNYDTMNDLSQVSGRSVVVFVYRNLTKPDLPSSTIPPSPETWPTVPLDGYRDKITQLNIPSLPPPEQLQQLSQFLNGETFIDVTAGDRLLLPSAIGGANNWGRIGFEIVFMPNGLWGDAGWSRLTELVDRDALTRRLDPMSFYARVKAAVSPLNLVADQSHALFTITTRRILLELRDEYDKPFNGTANVFDGGQTTPFTFDNVVQRGTVELPATTTFSSVEIPGYVSTELPSGDVAEVSATRNFTGLDHWALQFIYMSQNPALADDEGWFVSNLAPLPRYSENNKITPIRDGVNVFRQYAEAIRTLTQPGHFMCLAGWWLDSTFELVAGDPGSSIAQLITVATGNSKNAQVRALLWDQSQNSSEVDNINNLNGNGHAILDGYTHDCITVNAFKTGTHHQKLLVVYGSQGEEIAFCGGVDINSNRRDSDRHGADGGFHDVHAKVEGPAVGDIFHTFAERWNTHPDNNTGVITGGNNFKPNAGSIFAQVARTYPRIGSNPLSSAQPYPFAPQGSTTPLQAFLRAIQKAKKFIYIEDQYLTPYSGGIPYDEQADDVGVLRELRKALLNIDYLIMVMPNFTTMSWLNVLAGKVGLSWDGQVRTRRKRFIEGLMEIAPGKVHVFYLGREYPTNPSPDEVATEGDDPDESGGEHHRDEIYCHSKVWIIDDVVAKIGSANCNRRSYTHDSELDIVMVDGALDCGARRFARNFRLELWAEHLSVPQSETALLEDHKLALHYWLPAGRFASARIRDYDHNDLKGEFGTSGWDNLVDPDGR